MTRFAIVLSLLCMPIFAFGQTSAVVVVRGVDAGIIGEENMTGEPAQPVEEGDEIRTGPASVAIIAFDDGTRVTLGVESAVTLTSMTGETSIGFELGSLRVRAVAAPLRLESPVGSFRMTSLPAEAEFALIDGRVEVRVVSGGLTTSDLDPAAVVFLGSRERTSRIRRAGSIEGYSPQLPYPNGWVPNIYITDPRLSFPVGRPPWALVPKTPHKIRPVPVPDVHPARRSGQQNFHRRGAEGYLLSPARLTELMVLFGKRTNLQKKKVSAPLRLCASAVKKSLLYEIIKPA